MSRSLTATGAPSPKLQPASTSHKAQAVLAGAAGALGTPSSAATNGRLNHASVADDEEQPLQLRAAGDQTDLLMDERFRVGASWLSDVSCAWHPRIRAPPRN